MRWTSQNEKEIIKEWAKECSTEESVKQYLPMPDASNKSYWCKHEESGEIVDHDFDTVPELKTMLEQELPDEFYKDLILPLAVATFKEKKIIQIDTEAPEDSQVLRSKIDDFSIPEFVYVF